MIRGWHLREGQREVEALSQAAEHDERTGREGARCHLAARAFEGAARRALAAEAAVGPVGTGAPVAADAGDAASSLRVQLTVFSYGVTQRREVSAPPARTPAGPAPPKTPSPLKGRAPCGHAPCQPRPSPRSQWPGYAPRARPLPAGTPPSQPQSGGARPLSIPSAPHAPAGPGSTASGPLDPGTLKTAAAPSLAL